MELTITVPRGILNAILEQAGSASPSECCGLLSGTDNTVDLCHPLRNNSPEPHLRYFASPEDLFEAMREMREEGRSLVAIYHSHPRGQAYPSQTDIELAFYPDVAYLIQSLDPQPEIRAWRIVDRTVSEIKIEIVEAEWKQTAHTAIGAAASSLTGGSTVADAFPDEFTVTETILDEVRSQVEVEPEPEFVIEEIAEVLPEADIEPEPEPEIVEKVSVDIEESRIGFIPRLVQRVVRRLKTWF
ncbi:MAG: M67 family metallopeptidase [Acidobacteria bacterium]|nr:M67 family metallopeptidase [Acidobacteriota bacterium]